MEARHDAGDTPEPGGEDRSDIVREISHEEFNPIGTLVVASIYFLILVFMYIFMYFFEFADRGISISG